MTEQYGGRQPSGLNSRGYLWKNAASCLAAKECTQVPDSSSSNYVDLAADPIWQEAMDWLLRLHAEPDSSAIARELSVWLDVSDAHRRAYRKAERIWRLTGLLPEAALVPRVDALAASVETRRRWRPALLGAAIAASLVLVFLPVWSNLSGDYGTGPGEHRQITLEDGSRIELDSNSAVDVHFSAAGREVELLRGQAFFQVMPDHGRAFRVKAASVEVTVTGTAFDVSLESHSASVSVQSGSVRVDNWATGNPTLHLRPGERVSYFADGRAPRRDQLAIEQVAAWRGWQLLIQDWSLSDVVAQLERYQPGLVLLNGAALDQRRITAVLDLREPQRALEVAARSAGGHLQVLGPVIFIVPR